MLDSSIFPHTARRTRYSALHVCKGDPEFKSFSADFEKRNAEIRARILKIEKSF
jgi:hypothetical protein